MSVLCPHCKGDVSEDAAITRGRWWLHPGGVFFDGHKQALTRQQVRVLYAIARANGRPITHEDLPGMGAGTFAHHLRMIRRALGDRSPVEHMRLRGWVWAARP